MLKDKVIVISGGAGLVGSAFSRICAKAGANVVIAEKNLEKAEVLAEELGKNVFVSELDITSTESIERLIAETEKNFGRIDALVNASYPRNKSYGTNFLDVSYENFCENVNLHLGGYFLISQQFVKYFLAHCGGNIVQISSIYGICAPHFELYDGTSMTMPVEYAAIKAGINHLTKYMAKFCAGNNIRVNTLTLGGIFDNQPELFIEKYNKLCLDKGMLLPEDVAGALLFLLTDNSKYINGQNIVVDDGFSL